MDPVAAPRSPFGLGWARKLALANAPPGISLREAYDRQLLTGILAATAGTFLVGVPVSAFSGRMFDVLAALIPAVVYLGLLFAFLGRGGRVSTYAHALLLFQWPIPLANAILIGGTLGWFGMMWAFVAPPIAALLTGSRGSLVWTGVTLASFGIYAVVDAVDFQPWVYPDAEAWFTPLPMAATVVSMLAFEMLLVTWFIQQRDIVEDLLAEERKRAEALLNNAMPRSVAARLQRGEEVADHFDEVTVVFADLVGFTTISAGLPPRRVVGMLAEVFGEIDRIANEEGIEKVKTIGDCYMAVAGAPEPCTDHAERALRFAVRVRDRVVGWKHYGSELSVRIGVHSGPVMAGIIGEQRILWDLWGDTVNAASRLESNGVAGEVQVSESTVRLLATEWDIEDRGMVQLRGRAGMRSYIVRRPKAAKAADSAG